MRYLTALTLLAFLSACAVGPDYEAPQASGPLRWGAPKDAGELESTIVEDEMAAEWWTQFQDPLLTELITRARDVNHDVRLALLRFAESRAQRSVVAGGRTPRMDAQASYQRQRQSEFGTGTRLIDAIGAPGDRDAIIEVLSEPYDVYQAGFDVSWELDLWGRVRRAIESADASVAASAADARAAELTIAGEVARTYFEIGGVQDQLRLALADVEASESALDLAEQRAAGGLVTSLDVVSHRARLAEARARVPQLRQRSTQLANALGALLGEPPGALDRELATRAAHASLPLRVAIGVPGEVARRRPDVRSAEARLRAATAEIGVAVADLYPRITLTGGFLNQSLAAGDLGEWGARQWTVGPSLHLPIFDGGRRRAVVELRELQQQEAAVNYQRTVLRAWREIDDALAAYAAEQQRYAELATALEASRDAYEIARVRYEHGLTNFLVALDAQRTMLAAEAAHIESGTSLFTQLVSLYKALGGGPELMK